MTVTKATEKKETPTSSRKKARRSHEPPWNVVLHNDNNPINRVVYRLWQTLPDMSMKKATRVTWEAHTRGKAVAKTCHKELAELYEERLREKGLTVSTEAAR